MKRLIASIWDAITFPFITIAVLVEESRNMNEDGSWDTYWEKQNKKRKRG